MPAGGADAGKAHRLLEPRGDLEPGGLRASLPYDERAQARQPHAQHGEHLQIELDRCDTARPSADLTSRSHRVAETIVGKFWSLLFLLVPILGVACSSSAPYYDHGCRADISEHGHRSTTCSTSSSG